MVKIPVLGVPASVAIGYVPLFLPTPTTLIVPSNDSLFRFGVVYLFCGVGVYV